ncbi:hypothetical protein, partial [Niastella koreensis]|uniref:hypothetical protein n=1 Tax=Niastella koreensis TaxID=354356 RepID=UPI001A9879CC
ISNTLLRRHERQRAPDSHRDSVGSSKTAKGKGKGQKAKGKRQRAKAATRQTGAHRQNKELKNLEPGTPN